MHDTNKWFLYLCVLSTLLAFFVVILGAYTRLSDSGLGCPDWPGCYGHWTVPHSTKAIKKATVIYPTQPIVINKAWKEMIHRYAAGTLSAMIIILFFSVFFQNPLTLQVPKSIPFILILLLFFQGSLGMWTVTQKLQPLIVMGHLLGGLSILSLIWLQTLSLSNLKRTIPITISKNTFFIVKLGLILLACQIILGGWTSANYAALACPNFPFCFNDHPMIWDFKTAFQLWTPVGLMKFSGLMTIQMLHRIIAMITLFYFIFMYIHLVRRYRNFLINKIGSLLILLILLQSSLGILNVVKLLPMTIAISHNAIAALLLLTVITLLFTLYQLNNNKRNHYASH